LIPVLLHDPDHDHDQDHEQDEERQHTGPLFRGISIAAAIIVSVNPTLAEEWVHWGGILMRFLQEVAEAAEIWKKITSVLSVSSCLTFVEVPSQGGTDGEARFDPALLVRPKSNRPRHVELRISQSINQTAGRKSRSRLKQKTEKQK
jgi:hypothetical protein